MRISNRILPLLHCPVYFMVLEVLLTPSTGMSVGIFVENKKYGHTSTLCKSKNLKILEKYDFVFKNVPGDLGFYD